MKDYLGSVLVDVYREANLKHLYPWQVSDTENKFFFTGFMYINDFQKTFGYLFLSYLCHKVSWTLPCIAVKFFGFWLYCTKWQEFCSLEHHIASQGYPNIDRSQNHIDRNLSSQIWVGLISGFVVSYFFLFLKHMQRNVGAHAWSNCLLSLKNFRPKLFRHFMLVSSLSSLDLVS